MELANRMHSVLWIDDQIWSGDPSIRVLHTEGFSVDCATNAEEGVILAQSRPYDAILLDLQLPDTPGLHILHRLRELGVASPVVVVTGFGTFEAAIRAGQLGAIGFKEKPLFGDDLTEILRRAISEPSPQVHSAGAHSSESEWLSGVCAPLDRCTTRGALTKLILDVVADDHLPLRLFFGCAVATRLVCTSGDSMSVVALKRDMLAAIHQASGTPVAQHSKLQAALRELEMGAPKQRQLIALPNFLDRRLD